MSSVCLRLNGRCAKRVDQAREEIRPGLGNNIQCISWAGIAIKLFQYAC